MELRRDSMKMVRNIVSRLAAARWNARATVVQTTLSPSVDRGESETAATAAAPLSLLRESSAYGLAVRFLEVVQFHRYSRLRFLLGTTEPRAVAAVAVELNCAVVGLSARTEPTGDGGHLVELDVLMQAAADFDALPIVLRLTSASTHAPWTREPVCFSFTPLEAATRQNDIDEGITNECSKEFYRRLAELPRGRVLEIGSRARSGVTRRELFGDREYVGIDILPGEGVTQVGDVHELSRLVDPGSIDIVFSASVFEHLLMPWKVALEMNRVMKHDAIGIIVTHQACGMHDQPWDFWRFSDSAWPALFNPRTGFEILKTYLGAPVYIVPFNRFAHFAGFEASAGFYQSTVLIRKTHDADPSLAWNVSVEEVVRTEYPE